ncbi:MAG: dockerin type I domain-containing protein [bacterium]
MVLGQVKDNTYLGTKQMAAYLAAAEIYSTFYANDPIFQTLPALLETEAQKIANTLITASTANNGKISLSLDPANAGRNADASVILDGLFYPALGGMDNPILNQVKDYLLNSAVMSRSNLTVANGILLNGQNYGAGEERWDQFWMSKAFGSEAVMRKMFGETSSTVGEKAFANLLRTNGAYVDSFNPLTGLETYPFKLRFYPRGVVSFGLLDIPSSGQGGGGLPEPPPLPTLGDVNNDSAVDALDYTILTDNWGENPSNPVADIDANGVVNSLDLFYVLLNWTVSSPPLSPTGYTCNSQSWQCSGTKDCTLDQDVNCVADCAVNCDGMHTACTAVSPTGGSCELVSGEGYNLCTDGSNCICFADDYPCDTDSNCCSGYCQPTGGIGFGGACVGSHL